MNISGESRGLIGVYLLVIFGVMSAASTCPIIRYGISLGVDTGNLVFYRQFFAVMVSVVLVLISKINILNGEISGISVYIGGMLILVGIYLWLEERKKYIKELKEK